jgi:hypothetical protein
MILNTTHENKDHKKMIDNLVGKSYSFWEAIKKGGTGSKRMVIQSVSPNMRPLMNEVADINYASIEKRPKGILIFITKGLQNFTWVIPYYQLFLYKTDTLSIHAQGNFVKFVNNNMLKSNDKFFKSVIEEKIQFDKQYELPTDRE